MANPISSTSSIASSIERKIPSDVKPVQNDISDLATKTLIVETNPLKKITTILHRLPSGLSGTSLKAKEVLQTTKPSNLDEKEKEKETTKLTLKSFFQFEHTLALLKISGWTIHLREDFATDPSDQVVPISHLKTRFMAMNEEFISFLENKKLHYDETSGLIADEFEVLTFEQSSALIKEFTGVSEKEKNIPSTKPVSDISVKTSSRKHKAQDNKMSRIEKQGLIHQECIRLSKSKEGKIKLVLKALLQFEYFLGYLQIEGWNLAKEGVVIAPNGEEYPLSSQKDIFDKDNKNFFLFLERKKLHYDSSSGLLSSNIKGLTFEESFILIKEFQENSKQNDSKKEPFFVEISYGNEVLSDTRIAPVILRTKGNRDVTCDQSFELLRKFCANDKGIKSDITSTLECIFEFNEYLKDLKAQDWNVSEEGRFLQGPNDEFFSFDTIRENVFEPRRGKFIQYLKENGCTYDTSHKSIYMADWAVDKETANFLLRSFILNEKDGLLKSTKINKDFGKPVINYLQLPDFQDVKSALMGLMDYDKVLSVLMGLEWSVNEAKGFLVNPQGKSYDLNEMAKKWKNHTLQLLSKADFDASNLDRTFDLMKDMILTSLVRVAMDKFGMKFDKEMNLFLNGNVFNSVEEMVIRSTLNDLKIF